MYPAILACNGGSEWTEITAHDAMMDIVARASSRVFVGLPLCEWLTNTSLTALKLVFARIQVGKQIS